MIDRVTAVLKDTRFHYADEDELQQGIANALDSAGILFNREHRISGVRDRLDFLVHPGIAIEAKIKHQSSALARQLMRYLQHESVSGIIVVATPRLIGSLPLMVLSEFGKPLRTVTLMGAVA